MAARPLDQAARGGENALVHVAGLIEEAVVQRVCDALQVLAGVERGAQPQRDGVDAALRIRIGFLGGADERHRAGVLMPAEAVLRIRDDEGSVPLFFKPHEAVARDVVGDIAARDLPHRDVVGDRAAGRSRTA